MKAMHLYIIKNGRFSPHALADKDKHTRHFIICATVVSAIGSDCFYRIWSDRIGVCPDKEQIKPFETIIKWYIPPCLCCKHNFTRNIFNRS